MNASPAKAAVPQHAPQPEPRAVLICEDENGVRESLNLILGDHYRLILTDNGVEGLKILESNAGRIGLVLLDIKMPKINGLEILGQIKDRHPGLNVIMITGYRSVETASEAVRLGACGYIVKPFESSQIREAVKKHFTQ